MAHKDRKSAYEDKDLTDAKWMVEGVIADGYDLEAILQEYGGGAAGLMKEAEPSGQTQPAEEAAAEPAVEETAESAEPAQTQEASVEAAPAPEEEETPHPKRVLFPGRFAAMPEEPESPETPAEEDGGEPPPPPAPENRPDRRA